MNARMLPPALATGSLSLRSLRRHDGAALYDLVASCPPLDLNSRYAYLLLCQHHAHTSVVAEVDGAIAGAITAYVPPQQPDTLFVWQVAVAPDRQGHGIGGQLLDYLGQHCLNHSQLRWLETTISPSNYPSQQLFTRFAQRHGTGITIATLFNADEFGESGHEEERLYRIGPWDHAG